MVPLRVGRSQPSGSRQTLLPAKSTAHSDPNAAAVEVDTRTLEVVRRLRLSHPLGGLAAAGGRLWISMR